MTGLPGAGWSAGRWGLQREIGLSYATPGVACDLVYPMIASATPRGTVLVVDRCRPENIVREVDRDGSVLWELRDVPRLQSALPYPDGLTVLLHNHHLRFVDQSRKEADRWPLPSAVVPNAMAVMDNGDVMTGGDDGLYRLAAGGRVRQHLPGKPGVAVEPIDLQLTPACTLLVTDGDASCVTELRADGTPVRTLGRWRRPGLGDGRLLAPSSATADPDGRLFIAETRAHRIVEVDRRGEVVASFGARMDGLHASAELFAPMGVRALGDGTLLVADTGNRRVLRMTMDGSVLWSFGGAGLRRRLFSFPRSAQRLDEAGAVLVCDSYHDRVLELDGAGQARAGTGPGLGGGDLGLSLPRSANRDARNRTLVADGMNGRVLVLDPDWSVRAELTAVRGMGGGCAALADPHDVRLHPSGALVVVDSDLAAVLLLDERGRVQELLHGTDDGLGFNDPHQVDVLNDGALVVADSGNNRIVCVELGGATRWQLTRYRDPASGVASTLAYPRYGALSDGEVVVVDTDNGAVCGLEPGGALRWRYGPVLPVWPECSGTPLLRETRVPRWVDTAGRTGHLLTDFFNSRIVEVTWRPGLGGERGARR